MFKPLENMRVVTLALNLPGPLAAKRFAELGATVIKVEPPQGDPFNEYCPDWYTEMTEGQEIKVIDVKSAAGAAELDELLASTDLLLTAQRPAALERLGLGWGVLQAKYPKLNHVAVVGYPAPNDNHAGHDLTYQATLGLLTPPMFPKTLVADLAGGERAALVGLTLLMGSKAGLKGERELIALSDAAEYMAQPVKHGLTSDGAMLSGVLAEYAIYETADGWVAVAAIEPHFKANLKKELGLEKLTQETLGAKLKEKPATEWEKWANENDIPLVKLK